MCQVDEEDLERVAVSDHTDVSSTKSNIKDVSDRVCVKCGAPAVIHLRDEDIKCAKCLVASVHQKFRSVLAKFQISRIRGRVLVAYSGGPASSALLGVLREATSASIHSRLSLVPVVIYVDDGASFGLSAEDRRKNLNAVMEMALLVGPDWLCLHTTLEMVFSAQPESLVVVYGDSKSVELHSDSDAGDRLVKLMSSVKTQTGKEEIAKLLRTTLLQRVADHLSLPVMLVGDCVDRLAVQLITNTALGKGKRLPLDLGYLDTHNPNLTVVRGFKDITKKEITMYNATMGIGSVEVPTIQADADIKTSVYSYTEKFIFDLQQGFPQTVTTLCKTGDKLCSVGQANKPVPEAGAICRFCSGPMDNSDRDSCTAENSIALSLRLAAITKASPVDLEDVLADRLAKKASCGSKDKDSSCGDSNGCCQSKQKEKSKPEQLCYTCRWMMSELSDRSLLPATLRVASDERVSREKMRESIQEFLLDQDDN